MQIKSVIEEFIKVIFILFAGMIYDKFYNKNVLCSPPLPHIVLCPLNSRFSLMIDLDFTFLEMNPFTLVDGKPYPLDMRGELDDTAAFKNFKKCVSSFYIVDDLIWILVHFFGQISGLLMLT